MNNKIDRFYNGGIYNMLEALNETIDLITDVYFLRYYFIGSWKENKVSGFVVFSQYLFSYL